MAKKKNKAVLVVQEDDMVQAQPLFDEYHEIAGELHRSFSVDQVEPALTNINNLPEAAQVALLKALAKERHVDAADVLLAINELSPLKNIRKEARRALIHLEEARIYPRWSLPTQQTSPYRLVEPSFHEIGEEMPFDNYDGDFDEDNDEWNDDYDYIDLHNLSPKEVVENFVTLWVKGRFFTAYDLLTDDSPLRGRLARDEWVKRRKAWADEAKLYRYGLETSFIYERTAQETERWLPNEVSSEQVTIDHETNHKTIVLDWSMMYSDISFNEPLPELPQATLIYGKSGRHWFWSSYVLIEQEDNLWRIHSITDDGLNALHLPAQVLRERIEAHKKFIEELGQKYKPATANEVAPYVDISLWRIIQIIHYYNALIKQLPDERPLYEEIATRMLASFHYERAMVYLDMMAERFSEGRAATLRELANIQRKYSDTCYEEGDDERALRFIELAKENLHESLAIENTLETHVMLAEILTEEMENRLDEAEEQLQEAKAVSSGPADEANIEIHLGKIDIEREEDEDALLHFQRAAELEPESALAWSNIADAYDKLENDEEAKKSYRKAIELQPDNASLYIQLSFLYDKPEHDDDTAIEILKAGLSANPDSVDLSLGLSTFYMTINDYERAEEYLVKAEQIDPENVMVEIMRSMLNPMRSLNESGTSKGTRPHGDETKPARRVVESIPADKELTSKPFKPSHPKKKKRKR